MVTPSFVIVGAPHFLSITTLRPLGPKVTRTASASASTPRSRLRRAFSSNSRILAMLFLASWVEWRVDEGASRRFGRNVGVPVELSAWKEREPQPRAGSGAHDMLMSR